MDQTSLLRALKHIMLFNSPLSNDKQHLLKWLAYTPINTLRLWHDFTRRVCFHHSLGSKDHECLLISSLTTIG